MKSATVTATQFVQQRQTLEVEGDAPLFPATLYVRAQALAIETAELFLHISASTGCFTQGRPSISAWTRKKPESRIL
jgi:hypothetical protein